MFSNTWVGSNQSCLVLSYLTPLHVNIRKWKLKIWSVISLFILWSQTQMAKTLPFQYYWRGLWSVRLSGGFMFPSLVICVFIKGIWTVLPLPACVYRAVDGLLLPDPGGHRCQFTGVLHHSLHRGSLCFTHLHYFHLRSSGETSAPGRDISL